MKLEDLPKICGFWMHYEHIQIVCDLLHYNGVGVLCRKTVFR